MKLTDILTKTSVVPELKAASKADLLVELVGSSFGHRLGELGLGEFTADQIVDVLAERERLGSTGIKDGLAIPHGKLPGLNGLIACLGIHRQGVDFGALDDEPSHVFIGLLSSENGGGEHLKALARISRMFSGGLLARRLMDTRDVEEIYELIAAEDARFD